MVLSAFFYDVSGGEPAPLKVPSKRLRMVRAMCGEQGNLGGGGGANSSSSEGPCPLLARFDPSSTSWAAAMRRIPPRHGIIAQVAC